MASYGISLVLPWSGFCYANRLHGNGYTPCILLLLLISSAIFNNYSPLRDLVNIHRFHRPTLG